MVHIKKVIIKGFKSYKDQTEFEDFHRNLNVIVGRNGSGKSNFFLAIRFVLQSDMFTNIRSEDRQRLLYEETVDTVMSGFVEIHFDNSDGRFPIDSQEVVLRRSIGLKKDEYFLENKHVTKHDVVNLLESAGFSRSNPYYIVQQGKVTALALMKDSERLELLKDIAGTRVYDERREESMKIMKDSESKRQKINETLEYIEQRLGELELEKKELQEYHALDRKRRALEFTIYDKELSQCIASLEEIEAERERKADSASAIHAQALQAHDSHRNVEKQIKAKENEILRALKEKELREEEKQDLIKDRAKLELDVKDGEAKIQRESATKKKLSGELKQLEKQIATSQQQLEQVKADFEKEHKQEADINEKLVSHTRRINELYSKQGRGAQFSSAKERDAFLEKEIKQIEQQLKSKRDQIQELKTGIAKTKEDIDTRLNDINSLAKQIDEKKQAEEALSKELLDSKQKRDELFNNRKELWRRDVEMDTNIQTYKNDLLKSEKQLQSTVNKIVSSGLNAVHRIAEENDIKGVYGPLIELFECPDQYMTAVEIAAGGSLFFIVVDTEETAAKILDIMSKEKVGRVTFMPLNRLAVKDVPLPDSPDVKPMISELKFKPVLQKAFQQIFGKTLICRDLEIATSFATKYNLDCITLDGDQVNRRGAITGGYHDVRYSRLESMKNIKLWRNKLRTAMEESKKIKKNLQSIDQNVSEILGEMQQIESKKTSLRDQITFLTENMKTLQREVDTFKQLLEQKEQAHASLVLSLKQLEETAKALRAEIGTDLLSQLSDTEQRELLSLNETVATLKKQLITASTKRAELENTKTSLEHLLANNYLKAREEIKEELDSLRVEQQTQELERNREDLTKVVKSIEEVNSKLRELETQIDTNKAAITELKASLESTKASEDQQKRALQSESEEMEKLMNKRSIILQKKEEYERKIREIGSLPTTEVESYSKVKLTELVKLLHSTNQELKNYGHVNKKALDQYVQFTEQREKLNSRKKELDDGSKSIHELVELLDRRKDEAIARTFKGVAKHFKEVFQELVPEGKADLLMKGGKSVAELTGVKVSVTFPGGVEPRSIEQLSGGQKSLVALALIFAIQRCDPAPFYLFDEIDSALDTTYRVAVANMIRKQSKPKVNKETGEEEDSGTQFIVTTFKTELVKEADKCYEVFLRNKESKIRPSTKEEAARVIQEEQAIDEQVEATEE